VFIINLKSYSIHSPLVYSGVSDMELKLRDIVMAKKKPRRVFVQPHTHIEGDKVLLKEFAATHEGTITWLTILSICTDRTFQGMIDSFVTRFSK